MHAVKQAHGAPWAKNDSPKNARDSTISNSLTQPREKGLIGDDLSHGCPPKDLVYKWYRCAECMHP